MSKKKTTQKIWDEMTSGLDEIEKKYESLRKNTVTGFDSAAAQIGAEYDKKRNDLNTAVKTDKMNTANALLQKGLSASGESMQARLYSDAAKNSGMALLDATEGSERAALEAEKLTELNKLDAEAADKLREYKSEMIKLYLDQLNTETAHEHEDAVLASNNSQWLAKLALDTAKSKAELEAEKEKWKAELESEKNKYDKEYALKLKEEERKKTEGDRDYDLALSEQERKKTESEREYEFALNEEERKSSQSQFDKEMELAYLEIEKRKAKINDDGILDTPILGDDGVPVTPSDSAYDALTPGELFSAVTQEYKDDPDALKKELMAIVNDTSVDADYRYEFYQYAKLFL